DHVPLTRLEGFDYLSALTPPPAMELDHRTIVGDGPYNLQNGETLVVGFGIVAGNNLADLQANTDIAQSIWDSVIVSVDEQSENPFSFILNQNYPNPFNPTTSIRYALSNRQYVTIKVYDVQGTMVAALVNEEQPASSYEVEWNASNFPSGVYFYQLKTGSFVQTKKMMLLK
ncbi:MAG: T9SS type A sorting domain-containing protein, partial [Ignavibacteria bacterium]|nr:T9SS type A sorting domain-containing protein [Ignavibacteria bacterium]